MITLEQQATQLVIPRWLLYEATVRTGELSSPRSARAWSDHAFARDYRLFERTPAPLLGADLLGRALIQNAPELESLARYVVEQSSVRPATRSLAQRILGGRTAPPVQGTVSAQIAALKNILRAYPRNAVRWIDLARTYTIAGQKNKAERALRTALALAPNDRFSLRAAARCFLHFDEIPSAHEILSKSSENLRDPWVLATAASVAYLAEKPSPLPRKVSIEPTSSLKAFQRSELLEAFGMEEFINGKDRSARKTFRRAWENPSANVITHAEWITRMHLPGLRGTVMAEASRSKTAECYVKLQIGDFDGALMATSEWDLEEPYSHEPLTVASYICCLKDDYRQVIRFFEEARLRGLITPILLNNLAYALINLGELPDAARVVEEMKSKYRENLRYTLVATEGFLALSQGRTAEGLEFYDVAFEMAQRAKLGAEKRVLLHEVLALIQLGLPVSDKQLKHFKEIQRSAEDHVEKLLITKILSLMELPIAPSPTARALLSEPNRT